MDNDLLLLFQPLNNINRNLKDISHDIRRRESQPLGERHIGYTISLVDFNEGQVLSLRSVLDVVACTYVSLLVNRIQMWERHTRVVGEDGCVTGLEVKGA